MCPTCNNITEYRCSMATVRETRKVHSEQHIRLMLTYVSVWYTQVNLNSQRPFLCDTDNLLARHSHLWHFHYATFCGVKRACLGHHHLPHSQLSSPNSFRSRLSSPNFSRTISLTHVQLIPFFFWSCLPDFVWTIHLIEGSSGEILIFASSI